MIKNTCNFLSGQPQTPVITIPKISNTGRLYNISDMGGLNNLDLAVFMACDTVD